MSLTSRVVNLFSSGSAGSPAEDRNKFGIVDDGGEEAVNGNVRVGNELLGSKSHIMAQEEVEEEGRPRYLYVRLELLVCRHVTDCL